MFPKQMPSTTFLDTAQETMYVYARIRCTALTLEHLQMSFRFHQMNVSQWGFSKGFGKSSRNCLVHLLLIAKEDNATPFGPCIVASHVIPDPQKLGLKTTLNGKTMQDGTTA